MAICTSTIRYIGKPGALDITVKSAGSFGKRFAPTWAMVMEYKKNGDEILYRSKYRDILERNYIHVKQLAFIAKEKDIVLVCYCRPKAFCHRVVLACYLKNVFGVEYKGEI